MASNRPHATDHSSAPRDDEGSVIRSRDGQPAAKSARPPLESSSELRRDAAPKRTPSSTRPAAPGSLDDRIEQKLRLATSLMRDLPLSDTRVRLLHIAMMRRDEALLDGVLAELNRPA
jgi:hypothetical protein